MNFKKILIITFLFILILPNIIVYSAYENEIELYSQSAIILDNDSDFIFYEKNSHKKMYPASTTKILTAIIIIENCNLDEKITVTSSSISQIPSGYTSANLLIGEIISIKDLLYAFLIPSANDAGYVLAEYYGKTIEGFSEIMNKTAKEIGCKNSHFVNPSGIHDENHYTTAYDLALIAKYCMKNKTFREIVSSSKCTISATNRSQIRKFSNTNSLIIPGSKYYIENSNGIKTGYTKEAGNCLISSFSKDNINIICVVLGGEDTSNISNSRFIDTINLYNYIYKNYHFKNIVNANDIIKTIEISNATKNTKNLNLILKNNITSLVNINEPIEEPNIELKENLKAPIEKNAEIGTITYNINNRIYSEKLLAANDVKKDYFWHIIFGILFLFLIILIILTFRIKNKKK